LPGVDVNIGSYGDGWGVGADRPLGDGWGVDADIYPSVMGGICRGSVRTGPYGDGWGVGADIDPP